MFHPYRAASQPEPRGAFDLIRDAFTTVASVEISFSGGVFHHRRCN